jgi:hypothetical protein
LEREMDDIGAGLLEYPGGCTEGAFAFVRDF